MKTSFSSVVTPSPPNNVAKGFVDVLVVSNIEKGERRGYLSQGERAEFTPKKKVGNFHVSQQLLSMIVGTWYKTKGITYTMSNYCAMTSILLQFGILLSGDFLSCLV